MEARQALVDLTKSLRQNREDFAWGVSLNAMCGAVAKTVMAVFRGRSGEEASAEDLARLKCAIEAWFASAAVTRRHLVPCTILPSRASAFEFGPIRFFHVSELDPKDYGLAPVEGGLEAYFGPLLRMMNDHAASWLAEVAVEGCERERSAEIAGLAVDVALGGLQLVVPPAIGRNMARITARTLPAYRGSFAVTDTGVEPGIRNLQPGLGVPADEFDALIAAAAAEIAAMGRLVEAYLRGAGTLPKLRQAWCNGVYWFHEGMSEPLDSVATVKLETAIEILFLAESTRRAKWRMFKSLEGMFGVSESDTIDSLSDLTFKTLVNQIAETRSKVLHGIRPTLPGQDVVLDRSAVEGIARQFLIVYPLLVDAYENQSEAVEDTTEALLDWAAAGGCTGGGIRDGESVEARDADGADSCSGVGNAHAAKPAPAPAREPPPVIGGEGAGWEWINWVRAGLRDGSVAVNAAGAWLHNIADEAFVVTPACFEAFAVARDLAPATIRNRVVRLGRHRSRASPSGAVNLFRAVLGDGSRVGGMVFPGELIWDDDPPPRANAELVRKRG